MINMLDVQSAVFQAVDEVNQQLLPEQRLDKCAEVVLLGNQAKLDSMALVNLFVSVEARIAHDFNCDVNLIDENTLLLETGPFQTLGTFIEYVYRLIQGKTP
jgi:hypothetical protein